MIDDFPYLFGVSLRAFINGKDADCIRQNVLGKSPFPLFGLDFDVAFRPDNEERLYQVDLVEVAEIVVTSVEDVVGILLIRYLRHHLTVMHRCCRNMHVCRDLRFDIVQGVHLDSSFVLSKTGPPEHIETQVDGRGIEGVNVAVQVENLGRTLLSGGLDHVESELLEDAIIPIFVGFGEVASCHAFSHSEVVKLALMSLKGDDQITQTLAVAQLAEHHRKQLIPATEAFYASVSLILINKMPKFVVV